MRKIKRVGRERKGHYKRRGRQGKKVPKKRLNEVTTSSIVKT